MLSKIKQSKSVRNLSTILMVTFFLIIVISSVHFHNDNKHPVPQIEPPIENSELVIHHHSECFIVNYLNSAKTFGFENSHLIHPQLIQNNLTTLLIPNQTFDLDRDNPRGPPVC